jgi:methionyl-tRNA formyltransferase
MSGAEKKVEGELDYPYVVEGVPEKRIPYSYSRFGGLNFLNAWQNKRGSCITFNAPSKPYSIAEFLKLVQNSPANINLTSDLFDNWIRELSNGRIEEERLNLLLKRFEVTKRIYAEYDENFRPLNKLDYHQNLNYLKFAVVLILAYRNLGKLQYLNALLKLCDILCCVHQNLNDDEKRICDWVLLSESDIVNKLQKELI